MRHSLFSVNFLNKKKDKTVYNHILNFHFVQLSSQKKRPVSISQYRPNLWFKQPTIGLTASLTAEYRQSAITELFTITFKSFAAISRTTPSTPTVSTEPS